MHTRKILISLTILTASFISVFSNSCTSAEIEVINDTSSPNEAVTEDSNGSIVDTEVIPQEHNRLESIPDSAVKMSPEKDLYPPILHSDEFYEPVPMPCPINTTGGEDSLFIMPGGKTLYVFFTPDVSIPAEKQVLDGVTGIYVSHLLVLGDGNWSEPQRVSFNDDLSLDGCAFIQGNRMWFCSVREGYNGIHWFTADNVDGQWQNLKFSNLNMLEGYEVGESHITSDGSELYFHSSRPGGLGGYDIWMCQNINGEWQEPELVVSQFAGELALDNTGNLYFTHHFMKIQE